MIIGGVDIERRTTPPTSMVVGEYLWDFLPVRGVGFGGFSFRFFGFLGSVGWVLVLVFGKFVGRSRFWMLVRDWLFENQHF